VPPLRGFGLDRLSPARRFAGNDRRSEFQRMIEAGTSTPVPSDIVIVHSSSRFFRDHLGFTFYVRRLAKNGVRRVPVVRETADDPMPEARRTWARGCVRKWRKG
jgi:DNA invertase Pin-like site-specific DNA recombinase